MRLIDHDEDEVLVLYGECPRDGREYVRVFEGPAGLRIGDKRDTLEGNGPWTLVCQFCRREYRVSRVNVEALVQRGHSKKFVGLSDETAQIWLAEQ